MKQAFEQHVRGAYINLNMLIDAQFQAKRIVPQWRQSKALATGSYRSNFRGRGLEFEEVRAYQAGDDIRTIDWRVTARSGKAHTKIFREEHERPILLCVDQRISSFIGSQYCFKSTLSSYIAGLLTWSGIQNKDRVGGIVFNDDKQSILRPKSSKKSALRMLQELCNFNQQLNKNVTLDTSPEHSLFQAFEEMKAIAKTSASVFIISDFHGLNDDCIQKLIEIAKHNNVFCIQVLDKIEEEIPPLSHGVFSNGQSFLKLNTNTKTFKENYKIMFQNQQNYILNAFKKYSIPFVQCYTHQAPINVLQQHLRKS